MSWVSSSILMNTIGPIIRTPQGVEWSALCWIFTESAPRPIQPVSRSVLMLSVSSARTHNRMDWRPLVKERNIQITKLRNTFYLECFEIFV